MKTLLVPVNFTEVSENALAYATALAKKLQAKITLLHAYRVLGYANDDTREKHEEEAELFRHSSAIKLKKLCEEIEAQTSCSCEFLNAEGSAKEVIVEQSKSLKPDLLVMGTESLNPIDRLLFETNTGTVLKEAQCTLLVVPENASFRPPEKIVFAMDYHDSDMEEIRYLSNLAAQFDSELHIVHVVADDENVHYEENFFDDFKQEVSRKIKAIEFRLLKGSNISKTLEKYVKQENIDLLAVAKTKKSLLEKFFSGSVSQKLFYHTRIPLLIFQATDRPNDFF